MPAKSTVTADTAGVRSSSTCTNGTTMADSIISRMAMRLNEWKV